MPYLKLVKSVFIDVGCSTELIHVMLETREGLAFIFFSFYVFLIPAVHLLFALILIIIISSSYLIIKLGILALI